MIAAPLTLVMLSLIMCAAFLVTLARVIGVRRVIKYGMVFDVTYTVLAAWLMSGTLVGMTLAILSGLIMACVLYTAKLFYDRIDGIQAAAHKAVEDTKDLVAKRSAEATEQRRLERLYPDEYDSQGNWIYDTIQKECIS